MKARELAPHPRIFLDCDGVCANFASKAQELFGMSSEDAEAAIGKNAFWKTIRDYRDPKSGHGFYRSLDLMPDARRLFDAVKHLKPTILTGCPIGNWAPPQKQGWAKEHFPGTKMITCMAREKIKHLEHPGDVLVDDQTKFQPIWEEGSGIFVHHTDAATTLARLKEIYPIWFEHTDWWTPQGG